VQDAPVRLNSLRFGYDLRAAVISIISNPKFKGLARVSLITPRAGCEEQCILVGDDEVLRNCAARRSVVSLLAELDFAEEIVTNGNSAPFGPVQARSIREGHWRGFTNEAVGR
jgi:hypothetical protein